MQWLAYMYVRRPLGVACHPLALGRVWHRYHWYRLGLSNAGYTRTGVVVSFLLRVSITSWHDWVHKNIAPLQVSAWSSCAIWENLAINWQYSKIPDPWNDLALWHTGSREFPTASTSLGLALSLSGVITWPRYLTSLLMNRHFLGLSLSLCLVFSRCSMT